MMRPWPPGSATPRRAWRAAERSLPVRVPQRVVKVKFKAAEGPPRPVHGHPQELVALRRGHPRPARPRDRVRATRAEAAPASPVAIRPALPDRATRNRVLALRAKQAATAVRRHPPRGRARVPAAASAPVAVAARAAREAARAARRAGPEAAPLRVRVGVQANLPARTAAKVAAKVAHRPREAAHRAARHPGVQVGLRVRAPVRRERVQARWLL